MSVIAVTLNFTTEINRSVQVDDIIYYASFSAVGGFNTVASYDNIIRAGAITAITRTSSGGSIVLDQDQTVDVPANGTFVFFSKDNRANMNSLLGYYTDVKFENNSDEKVELYSVSTEMFESSK